MVKAMWNDVVIAEADLAQCQKVEGNIYFPESAIKKEFFQPSSTHSTCPWKGEASYYTINVKGFENKDAAWFYPKPKDAAKNITGHVAFWKGVKVV
ncbi:hypothetical protein BC831DRAFT_456530 [Entophlyctis helioformis]|nr:hypothetical protein BC831DRAFT_456530 [Entophlyctis helioformis]